MKQKMYLQFDIHFNGAKDETPERKKIEKKKARMITADCKFELKRKFGGFEKIEYILTENLFKESNRRDMLD